MCAACPEPAHHHTRLCSFLRGPSATSGNWTRLPDEYYGLAGVLPLMADIEEEVLVNVDDSIIEAHEHVKRAAHIGHPGFREINALTATTTASRR